MLTVLGLEAIPQELFVVFAVRSCMKSYNFEAETIG